jgi:predicted ATP-grasp superfamily ATP-dependent carboligase
MKRALVLDGRTLSSLAVCRSLGRRGYSVHCGDSFDWNLTRFSKYVAESITYPSAQQRPNAFLEELLDQVSSVDYDVVIPTRDATTQRIAEHQERFERFTNLYVADPDVINRFMDKGETIKFASKIGTPVPPTYFPERIDIDSIASEVSYPALVRPRRTSGSRGIRRVESPDELRSEYPSITAEYGTPIIQEFIEKTGYTTACVLLDENQNEIASFSYERVKEYPLSGGPTVVGVSTDDTRAKRFATELLKEAEWKGPAEVEFIIDEDGRPRLLEVNPRFWMPVHLAVVSGIDFPYLVAELAQNNPVNCHENYDTGVKYRWMLPNEILHLVDSSDKVADFVDMIRFRNGTVCYGVLSTSDPSPVVGTAVQSVQFLLDREKREAVLNRGTSEDSLDATRIPSKKR